MGNYYAFAKFILAGLILTFIGTGALWFGIVSFSTGLVVFGFILMIAGLVPLGIGTYNLLRNIELYFLDSHESRKTLENSIKELASK